LGQLQSKGRQIKVSPIFYVHPENIKYLVPGEFLFENIAFIHSTTHGHTNWYA